MPVAAGWAAVIARFVSHTSNGFAFFEALHALHAGAMFSMSFDPPEASGTTWSRWVAGEQQYTQSP